MKGWRATWIVGDQRDWLFEQSRDGGAERLRRELHLPELIDQHDAAGGRRRQRRQREALERREVDAVLSDSRRTGKTDMGEHGARTVERLQREADAAASFAKLRSDEAGKRNARLAQERGEPAASAAGAAARGEHG